MIDDELVDYIIGILYETILDPERWKEAVRLCSYYVSRFDTSELIIDNVNNTLSYAVLAGIEFSDQVISDYTNYYLNYELTKNNHLEIDILGGFYAPFVQNTSFVNHNKFFQDFFLRHAVPIILDNLDSDNKEQNAQKFTRHLQRVLAIQKHTQALSNRISTSSLTIEAFKLPMLIVNCHHEIIEANAEALQLLENQQNSLINKASCLTCKNSDCKDKLGALISQATALTASIGGSFLLAGTNPWHVFVKPLKSPLPETQDIQKLLAVVFVIDPTKNHNKSSLDLLAQLYNFSPPETALATALLSGMSPEEYALEAYLAISTVRSHLKKLFIKTNTHRQAELVALLSRLLPFRD